MAESVESSAVWPPPDLTTRHSPTPPRSTTDETLIWNQWWRRDEFRTDLGTEGSFRQMAREQQIFIDGIDYIIECCAAYAQTPAAQDRLTDMFAARFRSTYLNERGEVVTTQMVSGSVHQRLDRMREDRDYQLALRAEIDEVLQALDRGEPVDLATWEREHESYIRIGVTTRATGDNWGGTPWKLSGINRERMCAMVARAGQIFAESVGWDR